MEDNRSDIRDFLASRRARLTPQQVGLPPSGSRRRVAGLRREEVAVLAGVSTEWYIRLERGHITGVSGEVLEAVARALRLDEEERLYLLELARAAHPVTRASRPAGVGVPQNVQWLLDSMTLSVAFVHNGRLDAVAINPLGRALYSSMYDSDVSHANFARFNFLDPRARDLYVDWDDAADIIASLLRAEAGRNPHDKALRDLVGELSTLSPDFRTRWAKHNVLLHHAGTKRFRHTDVGLLDLTYHSLQLPASLQTVHTLTTYTAQPGTASEDGLKMLASLAVTN